jgi:hypothetical protein
MENSATTAATTSSRSGFSLLVLESVFRHRVIHGVALFTLGLGFVVGGRVGTLPDFKLLGEYTFYLTVYFWLVGCAYAVFQLFWLACVTRAKSPLRHLLRPLRKLLTNPNRVVNALNGLTAMLVFMTGFVVLKGAIGVLVPFSWDQSLAQFTTTLHFGRAPYQWLWWIMKTPGAIQFLNFCYSLWFVVMVATVISSAMAGRDSLLHQFLLSFMLVWLIGGFFIATAFSSAGPCYYAKLGLGDLYRPLMDALESANRKSPIWALQMQDRLWSGYLGAPSGSMGISAFPSIHVASSVLFALYATRLSTALGVMMWLFAAIIMVASVLLGWHYGVDGYGGALIAVAIWKATGAALVRRTDNRAVAAGGALPWGVDRPLPQ